MQIKTTRFGNVTINESDVLQFTEGPFGFTQLKKFILLDDPSDEIFAWLQSCEEPGIAFPVLEPELFISNYKVDLTTTERATLKLETAQSSKIIFNIVTIPSDVTQMTANLKAPIVINPKNRMARQVVVQENDLPIKYPIFSELQKRLVQRVQKPADHQSGLESIYVKLPTPDANVGLNH